MLNINIIMKKLKEIKNFHNIFIEHINELDIQLQIQIKKIKQEYVNNLIDEKIKLLTEICQGENLELDKIKNKYIKTLDLNKCNHHNILNEFIIDEEVLDKIEINNQEYYYENKENGNVYNKDSKIVGIFKNDKIILN